MKAFLLSLEEISLFRSSRLINTTLFDRKVSSFFCNMPPKYLNHSNPCGFCRDVSISHLASTLGIYRTRRTINTLNGMHKTKKLTRNDPCPWRFQYLALWSPPHSEYDEHGGRCVNLSLHPSASRISCVFLVKSTWESTVHRCRRMDQWDQYASKHCYGSTPRAIECHHARPYR